MPYLRIILASFLLSQLAMADETQSSQERYLAERVDMPNSDGIEVLAFDQAGDATQLYFTNRSATRLYLLSANGTALFILKPNATVAIRAQACAADGVVSFSTDGHVPSLFVECRAGRLYNIKKSGVVL